MASEYYPALGDDGLLRPVPQWHDADDVRLVGTREDVEAECAAWNARVLRDWMEA